MRASAFNARLHRNPDNGCWEWMGPRQKDGYGFLRAEGNFWLAHRWAWTVANGPIPSGLLVRHRCDNPPCCNPEHLLLGTDADNKRDSMERGRHKWPIKLGENHGAAKLTADKVRAIRADSRPQRQIAAAYGIGQPHVSDIKTGKKWSHV